MIPCSVWENLLINQYQDICIYIYIHTIGWDSAGAISQCGLALTLSADYLVFFYPKKLFPKWAVSKPKKGLLYSLRRDAPFGMIKSFLFNQNIYTYIYPFSSRFWLHSSISISFQPSISVEFATKS